MKSADSEPPVSSINAAQDPQSTSLLDSLASGPEPLDESDDESVDPSLLELGEETLAHGKHVDVNKNEFVSLTRLVLRMV